MGIHKAKILDDHGVQIFKFLEFVQTICGSHLLRMREFGVALKTTSTLSISTLFFLLVFK